MQDNILQSQEWTLDGSVALLIAAARRRIKQVIWRRLRPLGVTPPQLGILLTLARHEGASLHEVAETLWIDDPTASRLVCKLVRRRLVRVESAPDNRRRSVLALSDRGRALATRLARLAAEFQRDVEAGLSEDEQEALRRTLHKVIANLDGAEARAQAARRGARPKRRVARQA
jgi:DNA-binding MarR family transcriptional regulator